MPVGHGPAHKPEASGRKHPGKVIVVVVVEVVVVVVEVAVDIVVLMVVVVSPQSGGVGFVAALHVATSAFFSSRQAVLHAMPALPVGQVALQLLNSVEISVLQSLPHLARAGEPTRLALIRAVANRPARAKEVRVAEAIGCVASLLWTPAIRRGSAQRGDVA